MAFRQLSANANREGWGLEIDRRLTKEGPHLEDVGRELVNVRKGLNRGTAFTNPQEAEHPEGRSGEQISTHSSIPPIAMSEKPKRSSWTSGG